MNKDLNSLGKKKPPRKNLILNFIFILIAVLSVLIVVGGNDDFSFSEFILFTKASMNPYLLPAFLSVLAYVFFEGAALLRISASLGYKRSQGKGFVYSAADIYFSAITPSATGGQPASAFFMIKDGIPAPVTTVALIVNLVMYTLTTLTFGLVGLLFGFELFVQFSTLSKLLIIVGIGLQLILIFIFLMILKKDDLLFRLGCGIYSILQKLHLIRSADKKKEKLQKTIESYRSAVAMISGKKRVLFEAFILNLLQRASLVLVFIFTFLATGGAPSQLGDVWCTQGMVIVGANTIPIPGAMGVTDYLLSDGFSHLTSEATAVNFSLLARTISFYISVLLCGLTVLFRFLQITISTRRKQK